MMALDLHLRPIKRPSPSDRFNLREMKKAIHQESSRLYFCTVITVFLGALGLSGTLAAQAPPKKSAPQDPVIVLQQVVRRVRVDVVVTDAKGQLVTGLQASDFHVAEDRKPQIIRQFEWHGDENVEPTLPKRPPLPPHTFMNLPEAQEQGPLTVLLFDALNTPVGDQHNARA